MVSKQYSSKKILLIYQDEQNPEQSFRRKSSKVTYYQAWLNYSSSKARQTQIQFVKQNENNLSSYTLNHLLGLPDLVCRKIAIFDYILFVVERAIEKLSQHSPKVILPFRCCPFAYMSILTSKIMNNRTNVTAIFQTSKQTFDVSIPIVYLTTFLVSETP